MKQNNRHNLQKRFIFFLVICFLLAVSVGAAAEIIETKEAENINLSAESIEAVALEIKLLELIRSGRSDLMSTFAQPGMDQERFLARYPKMGEYFSIPAQKTLPQLYVDERLSNSARLHAQEMVNFRYFSDISLNGDTIYERMIQSGYTALTADEAMSVIFFNNYIPSDQAIEALYNNLMKNEQDDAYDARLKLLNPEFLDIGVSIQFGKISLDNKMYNFYMAVCDLGTDGLSVTEKDAFALINHRVPKRLNLKLRQVAENSLDQFASKIVDSLKLYNGLPLDDGCVDCDAPSLDERIAHTGYQGCGVNENTEFFIFSSTDAAFLDSSSMGDESGKLLMERMLEKESEVVPENQVLLNYLYSDMGLVIKTVFIDDLNGNDYWLQILTVVSGKSGDHCY